MEGIATDLIDLLRYLVPGFLSAWIFYSFTSYPKPSQFERIIQALIFTIMIEVIVNVIELFLKTVGKHIALGLWNEQSNVVASVFSAMLIGFIFAYFANTDKFHLWARKLGITKETSFASEWFGIFSKNITYIVGY
jgi:hypothetical protein